MHSMSHTHCTTEPRHANQPCHAPPPWPPPSHLCCTYQQRSSGQCHAIPPRNTRVARQALYHGTAVRTLFRTRSQTHPSSSAQLGLRARVGACWQRPRCACIPAQGFYQSSHARRLILAPHAVDHLPSRTVDHAATPGVRAGLPPLLRLVNTQSQVCM